jgi:hypothetical protein
MGSGIDLLIIASASDLTIERDLTLWRRRDSIMTICTVARGEDFSVLSALHNLAELKSRYTAFGMQDTLPSAGLGILA